MKGVGAAAGSDDGRAGVAEKLGQRRRDPPSSSTSSTCMALMLGRVGQNLIDFGLFWLARMELTCLALQL
jgi:hypothetical protein